MPKKLTINLEEEVYKKLENFIGDNSSLSEFIEELIDYHLALQGKAIEEEIQEYL